MDISKQLVYIKENYNLTQTEMSKKAGITQSTMSDWLNGKVNPTINNLIKLANNLNISLDYLVGRETEEGTVILNSELTPEEETVLTKFNKLNKFAKARMLAYLDGLLENPLAIDKTV